MLLETKKTRCTRCDKVTKHEDLGAHLPSTVRWKCAKCGLRNLIETKPVITDQEFLTEE